MPFVFHYWDHNMGNHLLKYIILPSIFLSIIALVSVNSHLWVTSSIHHFYIELFGTLLGAILAFYYISRAQTLNDKFSLFIGIGFLVNTLIDLFHVIVSFVYMNDMIFLKYFIPQTWFAGRLFLSAMLAIAIIKYISFSSYTLETKQQASSKLNKEEKLTKFLLFYLFIFTLFASIVAFSSLFVVFPFSVIDYLPLHRPYEIFPLALFLLAVYYFYKNKIYKNNDVFYKSIIVSIVFDIFGQIIMSSSAHHFDTAHNIAHVLKDASYFINIIGLALSGVQYTTRLRETNEILSIQYQKVKESEKMKDEFINIAAHELRTPIQPILGLTDIMYSKVKDEDQREILDIIIRNAKRLKRLTDNVLDVTKIESQSLVFNKEKLNLNTVISDVLKEYVNKNITQEMAKIVYDFKLKNDIIVEADKDRLSQVIHNLLDNALKFTYYNQIIYVIVALHKDKKQVIVSVKDTGEGISDEILPNLFLKFKTYSNTGTGLGLYICKNIIEAHGGKIWAENNSVGKGATFLFTLPIIDNL
ncbi:MAG: sensor histidine kinase [Nitrososphaeraceae archaeon]